MLSSSPLISFVDLLNRLEQHDSKVALIQLNNDGSKKTLSYSQLIIRIKSLALLMQKGVGRGDRVILLQLDALDWIVSYFAVISIGGIAVTIDSRASSGFVSEAIGLTSPKYILTSTTTETYIEEVKAISISNLDLDQKSDFNFPDQSIFEPCEIVFTSGTWSKPKGVTLSQSNIINNLNENSKHFKLTNKDLFLSIIPLSHMYEQMAGMMVPLYYGATIVYSPLETKEQFRKALKAARPTKIVIVPLVCELLYISYQDSLKLLFPIFESFVVNSRILPRIARQWIWLLARLPLGGRLNEIMVGGAPMQKEIDLFFQGLGVRMDVGYGLTETSPVLAISTNQNRKPGEVGKAYPIFELNQNQHGELLVRGPSVFLGYWPQINNPADQWFNTGDIVMMDQNGNLVIQGRSKNMIVYPSGDKIFAEDIEFLVDNQLDCQSCCINMGLGLANDLKLVLTKKDLNIKEIQSFLRASLPSFVQVNDIVYYGADTLPMTFSRKINRKAVKDWLDTVYLNNR